MALIMAKDGKILTRATGSVLATSCAAMGIGTCCDGSQPNAFVTWSNGCSGIFGNSAVCDPTGTYAFAGCTGQGNPTYTWRWDGPPNQVPDYYGPWTLTVVYNTVTDVMTATLQSNGPGGNRAIYMGQSITWQCIDGDLVDAFELPGQTELDTDCSGCTAWVTL